MKKFLLAGLLSLFAFPIFAMTQPTQSTTIADVDTAEQSSCINISNNLRYRTRDASVNNEVSDLQDFLNMKGYLSSGPTGYFGLATFNAVKKFQSASGFAPTGYVGSLTRAKIIALTCGGGVSTPTATQTSTPVAVYSQTQAPTTPAISPSLPAGCTSTIGFSPLTGKRCLVPVTPVPTPTNLPAGCVSTIGYSSVTGQLCSTVPSITVVYPNGGEQFNTYCDGCKVQDNIRTKWESSNISGNVSAYLNFADGATCLLGSAPVSQGSFVTTVTNNYQCSNIQRTITAGKYKILLDTDTNPADNVLGVHDSSDNYFTISTTAPSVPVPTVQLQETQHISDVFVVQDDGMLVQPGNVVNVREVAKKFYSLHPDKKQYDFLSIFTTFYSPSYIEFHDLVTNDVKGNGLNKFGADNTILSSLLGINFLGDTYSPVYNDAENNIKNNLYLMVHETGHQWAAFFGKDEGISDGVHYPKFVNNGFLKDGKLWGDAMGGSAWLDNHNGTMSVGAVEKQTFSPLSLYLMGLIPSSEVPPIEIVEPVNPNDDGYQNVKGNIKKIAISDLILKYGERSPSYLESKKDFKMAYILLTKKDESSAQYSSYLNVVKWVAKYFPDEWNNVTQGKSTINQITTSLPAVQVQQVVLPSISFTASPFAPGFGQTVTLSWSSDAYSCVASSDPYNNLWIGNIAASGSKSVGPINQTTTYYITCSSANGVLNNQNLTLMPRG